MAINSAGSHNFANKHEAQMSDEEVLISATPGVATASKALILDANGRVPSGTLTFDDMVAGTGISTGSGTICEHRVSKVGGLIKTEILLDLTGLNDGANGVTAAVVGKDGDTANCHIGQITAAKNGTIIAGRVTCLEAPGTGHADVDIWRTDEGTLAQDVAISTGTNQAQLVQAATWTVNDIIMMSALPAADSYLYLAMGTGGANADYNAGILLIELWGTVA